MYKNNIEYDILIILLLVIIRLFFVHGLIWKGFEKSLKG